VLLICLNQEHKHIMTRWHFCNFCKFLCLGSLFTRSQKKFYVSVHKKLVEKGLMYFSFKDPKPKSWLKFLKCH